MAYVFGRVVNLDLCYHFIKIVLNYMYMKIIFIQNYFERMKYLLHSPKISDAFVHLLDLFLAPGS